MADAVPQMLEAAERIVAERGLAALTTRAVQEAAGQRNKSAVQYHFGSREGLIEALLAVRMRPANERRTSMLQQLAPSPSTRDLVEVMVLPLVESVQGRSPSHWARFLLQALNDPVIGRLVATAVEGEAFRTTRARLDGHLGHLPPPVRRQRISSVIGYACLCLAAAEVGAVAGGLRGDTFATELVDSCCGLLDAPSTIADHQLCEGATHA